MLFEVERKFLTTSELWRTEVKSESLLVQGYLHADQRGSIRVRIADQIAWLTVKGPLSGATRVEFEYSVPIKDAEAMLKLFATGIVEKVRYTLFRGPEHWTVDVFRGANEGLVLLEIEGKEAESVASLPAWVGREVTDEQRYYNNELSKRPFTTWR